MLKMWKRRVKMSTWLESIHIWRTIIARRTPGYLKDLITDHYYHQVSALTRTPKQCRQPHSSQVDSTLDRKAPTLLKPGIVVDLVTVQHINKSAWCRFIACPRNHQVLTSRAHRPAERWIVKSLEVGSSDVAASLAYGGALRLETLASGS